VPNKAPPVDELLELDTSFSSEARNDGTHAN
jgi:hypothetical protein